MGCCSYCYDPKKNGGNATPLGQRIMFTAHNLSYLGWKICEMGS